MLIGSLAAALLAMHGQSPPEAADWWYVSVADDPGDQQAFYVDRTSIRRTGDIAESEQAREGEVADEDGILGARLRVRYDCRARTSQVLIYRFLQSDGRLWTARRNQTQAEPVEPDSVNDALLKFSCGESEGIEQLGSLGIREQALLLFADRARYLREHPEER